MATVNPKISLREGLFLACSQLSSAGALSYNGGDMLVNGLSDSGFNLGLLTSGSKASKENQGVGALSSFALNLATFKSQMLDMLTNTDAATGKNSGNNGIDALLAGRNTATDASSGLATNGRNLSLFDPESGYRMMTTINNNDVAYKAQYSELSQMQTYLDKMQQAGQSLGGIDASTANDGIKAQLQQFTSQYNDWVQRFDGDMSKGGVLAGTQAAQVSRYELDQNVENTFYGAKNGVNGLADLGLTIDANSKLAVFDGAKLDAMLSSNKPGVVATIQEFSANFAKSASLLNAADNFIPEQLANLDRAIHYIDDNKTALQAEFGSGDTAKPNGQVAKALAAYNASV